jgi:hypothetical protein
MFWSMDMDDFTGQFSHGQKYPLINAMCRAVNPGVGVSPKAR